MNSEQLSALRGSQDTWWRAEHYTITEGTVVVSGQQSMVSHYYPLGVPNLPTELARLKDASDEEILDFVHQWGLLGHTYLLPHDYGDPKEAAKHQARVGGDPTEWIRNHAHTVSNILHLISKRQESERERNPDVLYEALDEVSLKDDFDGGESVFRYFAGSFREPRMFSINQPPLEAKDASARVINAFLDPNIKYVSPRMITENGKLSRSFQFPALLPAIYLHLADAAIGDHVYVQCQHCHNYFRQTRTNQIYCPPADRYRSPKTGKLNDSNCSINARQQKYRRKS